MSKGTYQQEFETCTLCPHQCGVNRNEGKVSFCHVDSQLRVARASLHEWEEPVLVGAKGSGTIFFVGCPVDCLYCQNRDIARGIGGEVLDVHQLSLVMLRLQEMEAANINLVTATQYIPHIVEAIPIARKEGLHIPIVWNSSGYESVESLRKLEGLIDIYLPDFKYFSSEIGWNYSRVKQYPETAKAALVEMYRQVGPCQFDEKENLKKGMIIRQLLLPGQLEDVKQSTKMLYEMFGDNVFFSLMSQYTPVHEIEKYPVLNQQASWNDYNYWVDYAISLGIENAFIQEEEAATESFIPDFTEWAYQDFIKGEN